MSYKIMKVKELIEILQRCDPEMPVATHANNNTDIDGTTRVCLLESYKGEFVLIGNVTKRLINPPNWYVVGEFDDIGDIPDRWR